MGYIYKIINDINEKLYIGKTEYVDPLKRWKEHLKDCQKLKNEKRPLYDAMNKYGIEHFHFEVIEETDNTIEREKYWINQLRTYIGFDDCNGYNATLGGDGKCYLNLNEDEVINYHITQGNFQLCNTAKYFNVDRSTIKRILDKYDIKYLNMTESNRLRSRKIVQLLNGKVVNIFDSIKDAKRYLDIQSQGCKIYDVCRHRKSSAYGYNWMYYEEYINAYIVEFADKQD